SWPSRTGPSRTRAVSARRASCGRRQVLARLAENEVRPALDREPEVDPARREVDQLARMVHGEVLVRAVAELLELVLVAARDPARGHDVDRLQRAGHAPPVRPEARA